MTSPESNRSARQATEAPLALLKQQRSHNLFVLSNAKLGCEPAFLNWYTSNLLQDVAAQEHVLTVQHFEQHEVDITRGRHKPLDYRYLSMIELSLDGGHEAASLIDHIADIHRQEPAALEPAAWLYYPISEKVGRSPVVEQPMLTLAFTNAIEGTDAEFREWYNTRHIRHALNIPALVSGQCFALGKFQKPLATASNFRFITIYEQEGSPQDIIDSLKELPSGTLAFPTLDKQNFAEWVYRPVTKRLSSTDNG